jgi:hypothetical protein
VIQQKTVDVEIGQRCLCVYLWGECGGRGGCKVSSESADETASGGVEVVTSDHTQGCIGKSTINVYPAWDMSAPPPPPLPPVI